MNLIHRVFLYSIYAGTFLMLVFVNVFCAVTARWWYGLFLEVCTLLVVKKLTVCNSCLCQPIFGGGLQSMS